MKPAIIIAALTPTLALAEPLSPPKPLGPGGWDIMLGGLAGKAHPS
jgi:hypothetical protein